MSKMRKRLKKRGRLREYNSTDKDKGVPEETNFAKAKIGFGSAKRSSKLDVLHSPCTNFAKAKIGFGDAKTVQAGALKRQPIWQ